MRKGILILAILGGVSCTSPTAPKHAVPQTASHVVGDSTCRSGYMITSGDKGCP